ncbi:transmembrane protein putative [Pavlovales sp. CCMP2436]|nr:transmembrane protein putative [Pavlovales sp. CCMP2436]|mmetsp:Transcript_1121/g.2895  ORF Transcript_1121/g.2895 Transcript_1121/m.2895 type:complete len:158 (+) Transcript_1121:19-492(+)
MLMLALRNAASARRVARLPMTRPLSGPSFTERMDKTGRPMSPHLAIYKFPVAAISSITTRVTGVILTVGTSAIGVAALGGADVPALVAAFQTGAPALVPVAKFAVAYPLSYHWLASVRHTYWDITVSGLGIKTVRTTSIALFAGAGVVSLALSALSF